MLTFNESKKAVGKQADSLKYIFKVITISEREHPFAGMGY